MIFLGVIYSFFHDTQTGVRSSKPSVIKISFCDFLWIFVAKALSWRSWRPP